MNFYRRRPLALAISLCLAVSAAVLFIPAVEKLVLIFLLPPIAFGTALLLRHFNIDRICGLPRLPFVILCAALCMCFSLTALAGNVYADIYDNTGDGKITAVVVDVKSQKSYSADYVIRLCEKDGERLSGKGLLRVDGGVSFSAGDLIETYADFVPAEEFYESYPVSKNELLADGYVFTCTSEEIPEIKGFKLIPEAFFTGMRNRFSAVMSLYLDSESSELADALILGDRSGLGKIYRDFYLSGVTHLLALSGMHLAILAGSFDRFFRILHIRGRFKNLLPLMFVLFYTALTGFIMSVVRAAIMYTLMLIASSVAVRPDRPTALFTAVGIIVLVNPFAICDVSLQLSFFATLGVVLFAEEAEKRGVTPDRKALKRILFGFLRTLRESIATAFGASVFVFPLQWLNFGKMSLMGIPATLLLALISEGLLLFYPLLIMCGLMELHTAAYIVAGIIDLLTGAISTVAASIAEISPVISLNYPFVLPLLIALVSVLVYMAIKNCGSWYTSVIPVLMFLLLYSGCAGIYSHIHYNDATVSCISHKAHDAMLVVSNRHAMIVEMSSGSGIPLSRAMDAAAAQNITELDTLFLTDATARHTSVIRNFFKYNRVKRIFIPIDKDANNYSAAGNIAELASEYGALAVLYSRKDAGYMRFGDMEITFSEREYIKRSMVPLEAIKLSYGDRSAVYLTSSAWESETVWRFADSCDHIFIGGCGPIPKAVEQISFPDSADTLHLPNDNCFSVLEESNADFDGKVYVNSNKFVALHIPID